MLDSELLTALGELASARTLLVASDFDGVIAPIVSDPAGTQPIPATMAALNGLAAIPNTEVAFVSGRSLEFLRTIEGLPRSAWLAGSHGSEFGHRPTGDLDAEQSALLQRIANDLRSLAAATSGATIEEKTGSVAFHYRNVDPVDAREARATVLDGPGSLPGVETKPGKMVIELAVFVADKGTAIEALRADTGAQRVMFIGDDITDEDGFAVLEAGDVGLKVGDGETKAAHRVPDPETVTKVLEALLELRLDGHERGTPRQHR